MKPAKNKKPNQNKVSISQQQLYSGPVPDPESLAKYEQIFPGFADRLITMAEKEQDSRISSQKSRIETDKKVVETELKNFKRGQVFALIAVLMAHTEEILQLL